MRTECSNLFRHWCACDEKDYTKGARPRGRNGYDLVDAGCVLDIFQASHVSSTHSEARHNKEAYWRLRMNELPKMQRNGRASPAANAEEIPDIKIVQKCHNASINPATSSCSTRTTTPLLTKHAATINASATQTAIIADVIFHRLPSMAADLLRSKHIFLFNEHYITKPPRSRVVFRWHKV